MSPTHYYKLLVLLDLMWNRYHNKEERSSRFCLICLANFGNSGAVNKGWAEPITNQAAFFKYPLQINWKLFFSSIQLWARAGVWGCTLIGINMHLQYILKRKPGAGVTCYTTSILIYTQVKPATLCYKT